MTVIVDANIIISGIINPYGTIPQILLFHSPKIDFVIPVYASEEILYHKLRICKETNTPSHIFDQMLEKLLSQGLIFSADSISAAHIEKAGKVNFIC